MIKKGKIEFAEKLLAMVMEDPRTQDIEGYTEMFENCREQGYRILHWDWQFNNHTIAFSENRNSDDIVVYVSDKHEEYAFGYSDAFWASKKYFRYDDFKGARDYIVERLLEVAGK